MSYENPIPPVPSRTQEIRVNEAIAKSFSDQPYYKVFGNEAMRIRLIENTYLKNSYNRTWYKNFVFSMLFTAPIGFWLGSFKNYSKYNLP